MRPTSRTIPQVSIIPVAVNTKPGALTQLSGSASYSGATPIPIMVMDTAGKFLYVLDYNGGVYVHTIEAVSGALAAVAGSPFSTVAGASTSLAVFRAHLFVTNDTVSGSVSVFKGKNRERHQRIGQERLERQQGRAAIRTLAPGKPGQDGFRYEQD